MLIGLTYDLRSEYLAAGYGEEETAELDREDTVAAIEASLQRLGHATERVGRLQALVRALLEGRTWDLVFNICEGLHGMGREAVVPALLDSHRIPYTFSDPVVLALALHKALTKRVVRDLGVPTPEFAVVSSEADVAAVDLPFPLFAKPVGEGTGKGIGAASRVASREALAEVCGRLLKEFRQPVLVERFLPGRELTVGVVGTGPAAEVVGVMEVVLRDGAEAHSYGFANKENWREWVEYRMPDDAAAQECAALALTVWRGLGCRDAGRVDFRLDEAGVPGFMEVNPLAGLNPEISDLPIICTRVGISYDELLRRIVESASERVAREAAVAP